MVVQYMMDVSPLLQFETQFDSLLSRGAVLMFQHHIDQFRRHKTSLVHAHAVTAILHQTATQRRLLQLHRHVSVVGRRRRRRRGGVVVVLVRRINLIAAALVVSCMFLVA